MIETAYSYCPQCGGKLEVITKHGVSNQVCELCHKTLYVNQFLTASALIVRDGKLLVVRRAIEPFKGGLDLPGGYVEPQESARAAILRELQEELHVTGTIVKPYEVLGPDLYPFEGVVHHNADMLYLVDIGAQILHPDDDVAGFSWEKLEDLNPSGFAFTSHQQFIAGLQSGVYAL